MFSLSVSFSHTNPKMIRYLLYSTHTRKAGSTVAAQSPKSWEHRNIFTFSSTQVYCNSRLKWTESYKSDHVLLTLCLPKEESKVDTKTITHFYLRESSPVIQGFIPVVTLSLRLQPQKAPLFIYGNYNLNWNILIEDFILLKPKYTKPTDLLRIPHAVKGALCIVKPLVKPALPWLGH